MSELDADFEISTNNLEAEYEINEGQTFDCSFEIFATGTTWGNIQGDIENQTDLKEILDTLSGQISDEANTRAQADETLDGKIDTHIADKSNPHEVTKEQVGLGNVDNTSDLNKPISTATQSALDNKQDTISDLSDIRSNAENGQTAYNTIQTYGDIVTYDAANFATSAQGALADTALQPNDDISELVNDIGYITMSALGDYATLQELENGLATKQDTINDLSDIRNDASNGASAYSTIQTYGDIVTYNASSFATASQGELADTALQPNDNITELNNNAGYITSASLPTVNNNKITIQKNSTDVGSFTLNQSTDKTINLSIPTQASDINAVPTSRKVNNKALSSDITLSASDVSALPSSTTINDLTTSTQQDALNSGATSTNIGQIATNTSNISAIEGLIPVQATTTNQLADKSFVNSSIATNTANFIGTFQSVAELEAYSGTLTNNDYAFVETTDSAGNTLYDRYKYTTATTPPSWQFEYELNNSSFTANQWASINSGITANDVTLIGTAIQPNDNVSSLTNDAGYITSSSLPTVNNGTLTIQQNGTDVQTFTANQSTNATANILVPTDTNDLTNGAGYITGIDSTDISTALGYTPANASKVLDYYGTCDSNASSQEKVVVCSDFALATGASIRVKFVNSQSYNGVPKLNVNGTGAINVLANDGVDAPRYIWRSGEIVSFTYDGTYWIIEDGGTASTTFYGYTVLATSATSTREGAALTPQSLNQFSQNMIANYPVYSNTDTYAVGDRVRYAYNTWECNTAIPVAEAWNASHWTMLEDVQTQLDSKYPSSNPNGYTSNVGTVTSVNNTSPDSNGNVSLTIPTVNNGTLTITQNGTSKGTFSANQSSNDTIALTDTTYNAFNGADGTNAGSSGLVPAPSATDNTKFLKGDGTWATVSSGSSTDVQINGTSITSGGVANILTNSAYNASSNKIATMSDLPDNEIFVATYGTTTYNQIKTAITNGKIVLAKAYNLYYSLTLNSSTVYAFSYFLSDTCYIVEVTNGNLWSSGSYTYPNSTTAVTHTASTAVGSSTKPIYISSTGVATASTSTIGNSTTPVYLNAGTITSTGLSIANSRFDGQWVWKYQSIENNAKAIGSYSYALSNYLPDTTNKYEIFVRTRAEYDNAASVYGIGTVASPADNMSLSGQYFFQTYVQGNSRVAASSFILPFNANGTLYYQVKSAKLAALTIQLCGYRRIGTNT